MSTESNTRLEQIRVELAGILEERIQALMGVMKATEQDTRQIVVTELEISRYGRLKEQIEKEGVDRREELDALRQRTEEVRHQHEALTQSRDRLREEVQKLERMVREADTETESNRTRLAALTAESEALQEENVDLRSKIRNLEENIAQMKRLREELMSSVSSSIATMANLTRS